MFEQKSKEHSCFGPGAKTPKTEAAELNQQVPSVLAGREESMKETNFKTPVHSLWK